MPVTIQLSNSSNMYSIIDKKKYSMARQEGQNINEIHVTYTSLKASYVLLTRYM